MNIYEKMHAIMQDVKYLQKDDRVQYKTTNYKALSEEKVTSIMREQFVKHKLVVFPVEQHHSRDGQITHVDVKYRIVNVEDPADFIEVVSCGDGADSQDKGSGKAMTYSYKYMWLRAFAMPTGEDPDKISSEELDVKQAEESMNHKLDANEAKRLVDLAVATDTDMNEMLSYFKVESVNDMTKAQYGEAVTIMGRKNGGK